MPKGEISDRVAEAVRLVQLEGRESRRPDQLSGGQKQRVALARAIIKRPKVLLLDEPLGALDKKLRERTQFELVNIQESLGLTFVIVTHDQEEAMTVSTRMAIMNEGRVAQMGTPGEMYEYPTSRFVADFLGDVNVLEARVVEAGARPGPGPARPRPAATSSPTAAPALVAGETVWVAIRPEKFAIAKEPPADDAVNCMAGEVWDIGYLGDVSIYHVRLASGAVVRCTQANRARLIERPITWEDRVWLSWDAGRQRDPQVMTPARERRRGAPGPSGSPGSGRAALIGPPYLWLLLFFLVPFAIVLKLSLLRDRAGAAALPAAGRVDRGRRRLLPAAPAQPHQLPARSPRTASTSAPT